MDGKGLPRTWHSSTHHQKFLGLAPVDAGEQCHAWRPGEEGGSQRSTRMAVFAQSRPRRPARYPRPHFLSLRKEKAKVGPSHLSVFERLGRGSIIGGFLVSCPGLMCTRLDEQPFTYTFDQKPRPFDRLRRVTRTVPGCLTFSPTHYRKAQGLLQAS